MIGNTTELKPPGQTQELERLLEPGAATRPIVFWVGGAVLLVLLATFAHVLVKSRSDSDPPQYQTAVVTQGSLHVAVSATGNLQPTHKVDVGSELSGIVVAVLVQENDRVKKNQVLARLDTSKLRDQIGQSEAALASAQAKLAQSDATANEASANLSRYREVSRLSGGKVPSQTEMANAEATLARAIADQSSSRAAINQARAALSSDRTNLYKASIRSPIDGLVLSRTVEVGQTVAAQLQVATLYTIAEDIRQMELKVAVDEADVGSVKEGQLASFTVDAYPGREYAGKVTRVAYGSQTKDNVVSYSTVLKVRNDDSSLRPGMTATAEIATTARENVLLVPNAALRFTPPTPEQKNSSSFALPGPPGGNSARRSSAQPKGSTQQIWTLRDGQLVGTPATIGTTDGRFTEITGPGWKEGMQVVTDTVTAVR
jgi:HlyD family secretion protein